MRRCRYYTGTPEFEFGDGLSYTSFSYAPVKEIANACRTGAATNIIYGLAAGYLSVILPVLILAAIVFGSHSFAGFYGIALAALGMLSTLATCLTIDVYGPVCDNAGGIAEMAELGEGVRQLFRSGPSGSLAKKAAANAERTCGRMRSSVGSGTLSSNKNEPKRRRYARWLKSCGRDSYA